MQEHHFGLGVTPLQATQLAQPVYDDKESTNGRDGDIEMPFVEVLVKK